MRKSRRHAKAVRAVTGWSMNHSNSNCVHHIAEFLFHSELLWLKMSSTVLCGMLKAQRSISERRAIAINTDHRASCHGLASTRRQRTHAQYSREDKIRKYVKWYHRHSIFNIQRPNNRDLQGRRYTHAERSREGLANKVRVQKLVRPALIPVDWNLDITRSMVLPASVVGTLECWGYCFRQARWRKRLAFLCCWMRFSGVIFSVFFYINVMWVSGPFMSWYAGKLFKKLASSAETGWIVGCKENECQCAVELGNA